jgi:hypothetical protein
MLWCAGLLPAFYGKKGGKQKFNFDMLRSHLGSFEAQDR